MVNLIKPQYMLPIGGTYKHMRLFSKTFQEMDYGKDQILDIVDGDIIEVSRDKVTVNGSIDVKNVFVDGLGVGDVGNVILRDRQVMSEEGVVVVVVTLDQHRGGAGEDLDIISRGFVFGAPAEELLEDAKEVIRSILEKHHNKISDWRFLRRRIEEDLENFFFRKTERRPLILTVVVEV